MGRHSYSVFKKTTYLQNVFASVCVQKIIARIFINPCILLLNNIIEFYSKQILFHLPTHTWSSSEVQKLGTNICVIVLFKLMTIIIITIILLTD